MKTEINTFLNTNLLEKYLLGNTSNSETETVENYINNYPEVKSAYIQLQENLEVIAKTNAVEAPENLLNNILTAIDTKPVVKLKTTKKWYNFSVAASIVAILFAGSTLLFYINSKNLAAENEVIAEEIFDLRSDIDKNNKMLSDIMQQFKQLNNPETHKYILEGNDRAKDLKTVAYINPIDKTTMIDVVSLPELPKEQCYQIWAEVQDKMVNLGILKETDNQLIPIPYTENALGLNITIEPKNGNKKAASKKTVAEITLKK